MEFDRFWGGEVWPGFGFSSSLVPQRGRPCAMVVHHVQSGSPTAMIFFQHTSTWLHHVRPERPWPFSISSRRPTITFSAAAFSLSFLHHVLWRLLHPRLGKQDHQRLIYLRENFKICLHSFWLYCWRGLIVQWWRLFTMNECWCRQNRPSDFVGKIWPKTSMLWVRIGPKNWPYRSELIQTRHIFRSNLGFSGQSDPDKGDNQATGSKTIVCFQIKTKQYFHQ